MDEKSRNDLLNLRRKRFKYIDIGQGIGNKNVGGAGSYVIIDEPWGSLERANNIEAMLNTLLGPDISKLCMDYLTVRKAKAYLTDRERMYSGYGTETEITRVIVDPSECTVLLDEIDFDCYSETHNGLKSERKPWLWNYRFFMRIRV